MKSAAIDVVGIGNAIVDVIAHTAEPFLAAQGFAEGSMGPKVRAACWFAERTGGFAAIGSIRDTQALLRGDAGTRVAVQTAVQTG